MSRSACLVLLIAVATAASADTIRLKNGTFLTVDKVRDKGDSYEYVMGGGTYTIAKKFVEKVETGGGPSISIGSAVPTTQVISDPNTGVATLPAAATAGPGGKHGKLPVTAPAIGGPSSADESALMQQIITAGHVDPQGLAAIERKGDKNLSAMAYFLASRFELQHNEFETARAYMQQALQFTPDSVPLLEHYVVTLADTGRYAEALQQAERATQVAPNDALAHVLLGIVDYNSDRNADAIHAWQRALELRPDDAMVKQLLAKAEREQKAESHFSQRESRHFTLHYEGAQTSLLLPEDILQALEADYRDISGQLGFVPTENIAVILYTNKTFFDVTKAPSWAGGLNDGKIRVPVQGLRAVDDRFQSVLRHELTHSFLHQMTRGRCPGWMNEGLAQMMERRSLSQVGPPLAELFNQKKEAPMKYLEGSFGIFNSSQAMVAYAEALAAMEYLRARYGMSDVQRMLQRVAAGEAPEAALRATTQDNYEQFQLELGKYLAKNYGHGSD